jgi:hypothetical protein
MPTSGDSTFGGSKLRSIASCGVIVYNKQAVHDMTLAGVAACVQGSIAAAAFVRRLQTNQRSSSKSLVAVRAGAQRYFSIALVV